MALTLKALNEDGTIDHNSTEPYNASEPLKRDYFTRKNDILLRLSAPYTVAIIMDGDENLLVSAHFSIIRAEPNRINSNYLHWWLTQNRKRFYKEASGGSMMGTISSGYIGQMEISLPSIAEQSIIGSIIQLSYREQRLLALLTVKKKLLIDGVLRNCVTPKE
ncbi:MAG: restriction endonuclease subunit S [Oscillospiraceae bacterium]|jgi:restriction endonuclease S subunit|nr:restriction endonuclease subunit S [Oscillospiraceae bacterium]